MEVLNKQKIEYYSGWLSWKMKSYDGKGKSEIQLRYISDESFRRWFQKNADSEIIQDIAGVSIN